MRKAFLLPNWLMLAQPKEMEQLPRLPDLTVMETRDYSFEIFAQRFREMAYLNRGMTISLVDERTDREATFYFEGGLVSFVRYLNKNRNTLQARPVSLTVK